MRRVWLLVAALLAAPGCLVVSLHPVHDDESIGYDPALVGTWTDAEDNASITIEPGEWRSYKVHYVHPIETGDLTGYLTAIDDEIASGIGWGYRLTEAGVPAEFVRVKNAGHGFRPMNGPVDPHPLVLAQMVIDFLDRTL